MTDLAGPPPQLIVGLLHKGYQMICGQPLAQVTGQKQRRLPIHINKTCSHTGLDPFHALLFNSFSKNFHA